MTDVRFLVEDEKTRWRNLFGFFDVGGILKGLIFVIYFEIKR